ncbi:uncharacterized protein LOC125950247 [Anopheles darlingi]|uniref:uncharacterized protein LOC125950247 n=1 Tax=Anopheles darlingi TaxID=43151 RepID=UPI0021003DE8|nr:uncharacterized protein LOC125950247 [Anopheles darlingi]
MTPTNTRRPATRNSARKAASSRATKSRTNSPSDSSTEDLLVIDDGAAKSETSRSTTAANSNSQLGMKEQPSMKPKRPVRKRRRIGMDEDDPLFNETFEESIRASAAKNNLTPMCIKKLLKQLVVNDHVFAIVRLKEEEERNRQASLGNQLIDNSVSELSNMDTTKTSSNEADDEDEDEKNHPVPKLTRLKAKQLNQKLISFAPLNAPPSEVAALIRDDLNSDDDDDEYRPGEDDIPSDDETNTTISDVDSQPNTPASGFRTPGHDSEIEAPYAMDGPFKIPKPRFDSHSQSEQEQENIALRTRSKLCLTKTDIETLESTFVPPDITTDMYDIDYDMDQEWKDFLEEFTKPLPNDLEDDDDNDPEYVGAEKVPLDAEEMRPVRVSKKELSELMNELVQMTGIDEETLLDQAFNDVLDTSFDCNQIDRMLNTPLSPSELTTAPDVDKSVPMNNSADVQSSHCTTNSTVPLNDCNSPVQERNCSVFLPDIVSTPHVSRPPFVPESNTIMQSELRRGELTTIQLNGSEPNCPADSGLSAGVDAKTSSKFSLKFVVPVESNFSYDPVTSRLIPNTKEEKRYTFNKTVQPLVLNLTEEQVGFTDFQHQLLQQQLRMHVQLTTQHFLQTYGHPTMWKMAKTFKDMLQELDDISTNKPCVRPCNLETALDCCQSWEDELSVPSDLNDQLREYWRSQEKRMKRPNSKYSCGEFHWRVMEKMLNCKAFIYPALIPYKPFRTVLKPFSSILEAEERLIAFGLELYYEKERKEMKQSSVCRKIDLTRVCYQIAKHLLPNHSYHRVTRLVRSKKYGSIDNPITFYLTYGYAPPFNHTLEIMDFDNIIPLAMYQKGILHHNWDRYLHSVERARRGLTYVAESGSAVQQPVRGGACAAKSTEPPSGVQFQVDILLPGGVVELFKTREEISPTPPVQIPSTVLAPPVIPGAYNVAETAGTSTTLPIISSHSVAPGHDVSVLPGSTSTTTYRINNNSSSNESIQAKLNCDIAPSSTQQQSHASSVSPRRRWTKVDGKENGAPRSRAVANAILYGVLSRYVKLLKTECTAALGGRSEAVKSLVGPIRKVYGHFKLLEVYGRFLGDLRKMSENLTAYRHRYKSLQQFRSLQQDGLWQFAYNSLDGSLIVSARRVASCLVEDRYGMDDKDAVFAFNYYEKVEDVLLAAGRADLLDRFEELIKGFNECDDQATALYRQIEQLLSEEFPDLVDMFLTFLLPGQAVAVGKFMEHFILTNMNDFLEKLNIFFAKQPAQIRKIHACLNELSNEANVTMEQVKQRILPLLKGSTLLSEWFLQLFPTEAAPDVAPGDYETITTKRNPPVDGGDGDGIIYEHVPYVETGPEPPESVVSGSGTSNTIRYIQGRIIYGALPVRLSFLATNCVVPIGANGESAKELQLCDDATLRAHAIRLNPLAHSTKHNSMVASNTATAAENPGVDINGGSSMGLARDVHTSGTIGRHHDDEGSPKKASPKLPIKKRFVSPVSAGRLTPTSGSERTPPPSAQGGVAKKAVNGHTPTAPTPDSKALSTSKKLRTLINAPNAALNETTSSNMEPELVEPVPLALDVTDGSVDSASIASTTDDTEESTIVSANEEDPSDDPALFRNGSEPERTTAVATAAVLMPVPDVTSWTREEDKIILEEMKNGYSTVESFVQTIASKLTERSGEQIRNRFEFLLEVLLKVNQK